MQTYCACYDDPIFALYAQNQDMSPAEFVVLWIVDRKSKVTGRMSFAEIAREAHLSARTVGDIVRRHAGKALTFIREVGRSGIIRVSDSGRKNLPTSTPEPRKNFPTPIPPTLPALPEGDLKALRLSLRVNQKEGVKAPPTPRFSIEERDSISSLASFHAELRGADTNQPPVFPGADLCLRTLGLLRLRGAVACRYLLIAHFHEVRQQKSGKTLLQFDSLHHAFPWVVEDGKKKFNEINLEWADERIQKGEQIARAQERERARKQEQKEYLETEVKRDFGANLRGIALCKKALGF